MCIHAHPRIISWWPRLRNPLAELLWEAESGPAIGAPVHSLGQNAAARPRPDQSALPDGGAQQVVPPPRAATTTQPTQPAAAAPVPPHPAPVWAAAAPLPAPVVPQPATTTANGVPTSCAELFLQNPDLPDGSYTIQTAFGAE
eukprot:COSAG04_NODE_15299_length_536_cov_1.173913_1_plen_142_part_01